jgi:Cys-rich four helix bundle protein (predicted Tat secretion target)
VGPALVGRILPPGYPARESGAGGCLLCGAGLTELLLRAYARFAEDAWRSPPRDGTHHTSHKGERRLSKAADCRYVRGRTCGAMLQPLPFNGRAKMKRRDLLLTAGSLAASAVAATADSPTATHIHEPVSPLIQAASHCVQTGNVCSAHCLDLLAQGDTSIAGCARSVETLRTVCGSLAVLAAQKSPLLPRYASVAKEACDNCAQECRKHADMHAPCKACMESCETCARECARVAA